MSPQKQKAAKRQLKKVMDQYQKIEEIDSEKDNFGC